MNAFQNAPESKKRITLIAIYCALFGATMVSAVQSTMLPLAAKDIGGEDIYSLTNVVISLVSVIAMSLYGFFASKDPSAKVKLFSFSLIAGGLVFLIRLFIQSMWLIVIPSGFYGLVSAAAYVIGYSLIRDIYDREKAAKYLGFVVTVKCVAQVAGPLVAGRLMDAFGWRVANNLIWPFMIAAGILAQFGVKPTKEEVKSLARNVTFDASGACFLLLTLTGFLAALSLGGKYVKFGTIGNWALVVIGVIGVIGLSVVAKKKGDKCIVPARVLSDRNTVSFALNNFFGTWANTAVNFFLPSYCIYILGATATQASLTTTMAAIAGIFMGPIIGKMIQKKGDAKPFAVVSTASRMLMVIALIFILENNLPLIFVYLDTFLIGFGNSLNSTVFAVGPQIQLSEKNRIQGNSIIQLAQNFGGGVANAVFSMLIGMYGIQNGMSKAFILSAVVYAAALVAIFFLKPVNKEESLA